MFLGEIFEKVFSVVCLVTEKQLENLPLLGLGADALVRTQEGGGVSLRVLALVAQSV